MCVGYVASSKKTNFKWGGLLFINAHLDQLLQAALRHLLESVHVEQLDARAALGDRADAGLRHGYMYLAAAAREARSALQEGGGGEESG